MTWSLQFPKLKGSIFRVTLLNKINANEIKLEQLLKGVFFSHQILSEEYQSSGIAMLYKFKRIMERGTELAWTRQFRVEYEGTWLQLVIESVENE